MSKRIIFWLAALCSTANISLRAQIFNYIADINSKVAQIPYVFEGRVTSVEIFPGDEYGNRIPDANAVWNSTGDIAYFYDAAGNEAHGYTRAKIKVCKVYKGNIEPGQEIEVLTRSFSIGNIFLWKTPGGEAKLHYLNMPTSHDPNGDYEFILPSGKYKKKLYFADKLDPIVPANYVNQRFYSNFHSLYELPFWETVDVQNSNGYWERKTAYCSLVPYVFDDWSQLQVFLNQIQTINPNPPDYCRDDKPEIPHVDDPVVDNSGNAAEYQKWLEFLEWRKANGGAGGANKTTNTASNDLTLDLLNERIVKVGNTNWLEFDVYVSASGSTMYLDGVGMNLQYNNAAFNSSVVTNNNCVFTLAGAFNIPTYYSVSSDISGSILGLGIGPNTTLTPLARVQINSTPQILATCRIKIINCGWAYNLSFTNNTTMAFNCSYATSPNQSILSTVNFGNVFYIGTLTDLSCNPKVTSFNNNLPGGIGRILTINGNYFGTSRANGTLIFPNADLGGQYPLPGGPYGGGIHPIDVISWTDDQIVVKVPNLVDSAYVQTQTLIHKAVAGSGKFIIKNSAGGQVIPTTDLNIPWSIIETPDAPSGVYLKVKPKLVNQDNGGYRVHMNNVNISTWGAASRAVTKKAMKDWSCATGINWFMSSDTAKHAMDDLICVIDTTERQGKLAFTDRDPRTCIGSGPPFEYWIRSFDIKVNITPGYHPLNNPSGNSWSFDTTGTVNYPDFDYYHTISHELGHAHGVDHVNDPNVDLMYYGVSNNTVSFLQRKLVKPSFESRQGGNWMTDSLSAIAPTCKSAHVQIYPANCLGFDTRIKKNGNIPFDISIYPNPSYTDENVKIVFETQAPNDVSVYVYDMTGKLIVNDHLGVTNKVNYDVQTEKFEQGIYLIQINAGGAMQSYKIIKQ